MRYSLASVLILVFAQAIICNFLHISHFLTLSILPVLILCLPTKYSTTYAMVAAFVIGFLVDFMAEGVLGLNIFALVPVGLSRRKICNVIFGKELVARMDDFSVKKYGVAKVALALAAAQAIFLLFYIWADGGRSWPAGTNVFRFILSLLAGMAVSLPIANMLTKEGRA